MRKGKKAAQIAHAALGAYHFMTKNEETLSVLKK
jgi:peptidyl-tRNA hydrolase